MATADKNDLNVGQTLYDSLPHFVNADRLLSQDCQNLITKYNYCKSSKTPPYLSLESTPANFIDDFLVVEQELKQIQKEQAKANQDGS